MIAFIDDHRAAYGVEPICKVLPIASSTYHAHAARRADPKRALARARSDAALCREIQRVENFQVYGRSTAGLAAVEAGGHRGGTLHGGAPDAATGAEGRNARQAGENDDQ
jgi:hypothetical protein